MSDFDFDEVISDADEDVQKQVRDVAATILAGLDQARSEMNMPWTAVSWKRMKELSQRMALETVDYTPYEGLLIGTWMAASSRSQIRAAQEA